MIDELQLSRPRPGVAMITLNRAKARNAMTTAMQRALDSLLATLAIDDDVRAIVITGAGDQAFSAGYDIKELGAFGEDQMLANYAEREALIRHLADFPKPLIGAINGVAHGAGAIISSLFDIRVGCARSEFRFTAVAYGGVNNTWQLPRIVGVAKALEFTMTARAIAADEALRAGLLNELVPDEQLRDKAVEIAASIAQHPPAAVRQHKALIRASLDRSIDEAYEAENAVMRSSLRPSRPADLFQSFLADHPDR